MRKYIAEFIGTAVLVTLGCGTAMLVGCDPSGSGYLLTALAFGLSIVALAYSVGNISGCHVNPAVSLGFLISGKMKVKDFCGYVIAQFLGAVFGTFLLFIVFEFACLKDMTGAFGSNGLAGTNGGEISAIVTEIGLTFVFVFTILGVTSEKANHGSFGGLVIGLTLTLVHIFGIAVTGTSVNPARSFGPALFSLFFGNPEPMKVLWIFIVAPLIGAALAAVIYKALEKTKKA